MKNKLFDYAQSLDGTTTKNHEYMRWVKAQRTGAGNSDGNGNGNGIPIGGCDTFGVYNGFPIQGSKKYPPTMGRWVMNYNKHCNGDGRGVG